MIVRAALIAVLALMAVGAFLLLRSDGGVRPGSIAADRAEVNESELDQADLALDANGSTESQRRAVDGSAAHDVESGSGDSGSVNDGRVGTASTWADLLAPYDDRTGLPVASFRVDVLTTFDAEVERLTSDDPLEEKLLAQEALARFTAIGFATRVVVTSDLAGHARPIPMPMRATTTVQIDVRGDVPPHLPDLELSIQSRADLVERRLSQWFDVGPAARPDLDRTLDWSRILSSERSRDRLSPTSESSLSAFDVKLELAEGEPIVGQTLHDVPVGALLTAQLRVLSFAPPVSATFLREDGSLEMHPYVMDREVLDDGSTTITLQFGGTATLCWSFDSLVGHSSGSFKLFDLSNAEIHLTAVPERLDERIAGDGGALEPGLPTGRAFTARNIPPGRYTFWALWKEVDGSTGSCELPVTLLRDETLDVGDLTSDPRHSIEISPRLTIGEGVPDELVQDVRRSIEWTAGAFPADTRRDAFDGANRPRRSCTGLGEVIVLEDVAPGTYFVGGEVRSTPGLELRDEFAIFPVLRSSFEVSEDQRVEVEFRLVSTTEVIVEVAGASASRSSWTAAAFQDGESGESAALVVPLEPLRGASSVENESTRLSGRLGPGTWRIVVVETMDVVMNSTGVGSAATRVATTQIVVGASPLEPVQVELMDAVTLVIELNGRASGTAQRLFASPQRAAVPVGWPEYAAFLSFHGGSSENVLRYFALIPHTEYTLLADGSTFLTGEPRSVLTLSR
jgi:hypothetical protein